MCVFVSFHEWVSLTGSTKSDDYSLIPIDIPAVAGASINRLADMRSVNYMQRAFAEIVSDEWKWEACVSLERSENSLITLGAMHFFGARCIFSNAISFKIYKFGYSSLIKND